MKRRFRRFARRIRSRLRIRSVALRGLPDNMMLGEGRLANHIETDLPDIWPFESGLQQLRMVVTAARAAGVRHVVNPDPNGISYRVVIREPEAGRFWQELLGLPDTGGTYARWTNTQGREAQTRLLSECTSKDLHTPRSVLIHRFLRTDRRGATPPREAGCTVETWSPRTLSDSGNSTQAWASPTVNPKSRLVRWERSNELDLDVPWGTVPTLDPFLKDSFFTRSFPVDAVYFWVDGDDPVWRKRRDQARRSKTSDQLADSLVESRFRQHDELRYSLRSLEYFAPWIRRIFLLTDRQRPPWLVNDPNVITVTDHTEIWDDPSALPTFNSHALSAQAHHIPGLAENYLLLNDDVFFGAPVLPSNWFTPSGQPIFHNTSSTLPDQALLDYLPTHIHARYNSLALVEQHCGYQPTRLFQHGPLAQSRSWSAELEQRFPAQYAHLTASGFRQTTDIEPIWLHHYLGHAEGRTVPGSLKYAYIEMGDPTAGNRLARLAERRFLEVFCLNDQDGALPENLQAMTSFLKRYFPVPSRFEKRGASSQLTTTEILQPPINQALPG